tara:strand:+ start:423 stop:611 length:189 start_codon:yes stop_codon:yes gene_type:complete
VEWTIGGGKMSDTKLETINVLANVLSAIKNSFIPDRNVKDDIVIISSALLLEELKKLEKENR